MESNVARSAKMRKLFAKTGFEALEKISHGRTLYAFDYDGTLSAIARHPGAAGIKFRTNARLQKLSQYAPVAILTGRSINDLKRHLRFVPPYLIGNHGLECVNTDARVLHQSKKLTARWKAKLQTNLHHCPLQSGIEVEDKTYSLAIHYRNCISKKLAKLEILNLVGTLNPKPKIVLGKSVVNVLPERAPSKGVALLELMLTLKINSAFYIGDDDTDEDVFSLPSPQILTVRVGKKARSQARFYIGHQNEIDLVLKLLHEYRIKTHLVRP